MGSGRHFLMEELQSTAAITCSEQLQPANQLGPQVVALTVEMRDGSSGENCQALEDWDMLFPGATLLLIVDHQI